MARLWLRAAFQLNCGRTEKVDTIEIADRVYLYDNSIENKEPRLILKTADGKIAKRYTDDIPDWVKAIIIASC